MSPFPWPPMLAIAVSLVCHSYSLSSLFPYVGYMVRYLGVTDDKDQAGYYAGYLSAAFMVGRFASSYAWGRISDIYGRLPVMYMGTLTIIVFSLMFGLSTNFVWAFACRFLLGALNGLVATSKTMISEICGKEHEVSGMGFTTASWSLGFVIGPGLGGLLAEPAEHYPRYFPKDGVFGRFPYLLPNVFGAAIGLAALPMMALYLRETRHVKHDGDERDGFEPVATSEEQAAEALEANEDRTIEMVTGHGTAVRDSLAARASDIVDDATNHLPDGETSHAVTLELLDCQRQPDEEESSAVLRNEGQDKASQSIEAMDSALLRHCHRSKSCSGRQTEQDPAIRHGKEWHPERYGRRGAGFVQSLRCRFGWCAPGGLLTDPQIRMIVLTYGLFSFVSIGFDETYPLWALSTMARGGLDWTTTEIGKILSACGVGMLIFQLFVYPTMVKHVGIVSSQRWAMIVAVPAYLLFPLLIYLRGMQQLLPVASVALILIVKMCTNTIFVSLSLATNNAVDSSRRGALNGLSMAVGSLAKSMGPAVFSLVYAWSIRNPRPFPFDFHLLFAMLALSMAMIAYISRQGIPLDVLEQAKVRRTSIGSKQMGHKVLKQDAHAPGSHHSVEDASEEAPLV